MHRRTAGRLDNGGVATHDPELQAAVASYTQRTRPGPVHLAFALVLLVGQFVLMQAMLFVVGVSVMRTDVCAYQDCGDLRWANRAVAVELYGGCALVVGSAVLVVWRLVKGRRALGISVTACVLQLVLGLIALLMMGLAGPANH